MNTIELPSGRKVKLQYHQYSTGTQAFYVDLVDVVDRVARVSKTWTFGENHRVWLKATINFNWPNLTQNDMADFLAVVEIARKRAAELDDECTPGQRVNVEV